MEQLLEFLFNHPVLTLAFFGLLAALVWTTVSTGGSGQVTPADAVLLISREDAVVLDLRPDGEFRNGHIVNAVHIPIEQLDARMGKLHKYRQRPVIAACRTGQQSARVAKRLGAAGFERVLRLRGGMLAWQSADLPLTKS